MDLAVLTQIERESIGERQSLPERYLGLPDEEMDARIAAARGALGSRLVVLGHHYQRDEVIKFADCTGDSLRLSREAARHGEADYIVFCGVHFMAESADILSAPHQQVVLPDLAAGCSLADMADIEQLEMGWRELEEMDVGPVLPVTYINSAAALKAFCGEHGGVVCTSSNAAAALRWGWARAERILFLPDQHLGRNTAYKIGVPLEEMAVWDPNEIWGGLTPEIVRRSRILLWKGHCSVHGRFTEKQIEYARAKYPGIRVIVHPECTWDVVEAADDSGSTEYILKQIHAAPAGTSFAVGTEIHLVNRVARAVAPEKFVTTLDPYGCLCSTMFRISPNHLLWALEELVKGHVVNRIAVSERTKKWALVALDRMLSIE